MEKRRQLYWTPCAAHCIDLMLEDIGKLKVHEDAVAKSKQVVKYIYGHTLFLDMMRSFTKNIELLRPAVTRFASSYLTLQSIYKQKQALISMFSSETWASSPYAKKVNGVKVRAIVLFDSTFWSRVAYCIKSTIPLVSVLREVDSEERPAMGFIYELMDLAKEKIAYNCGRNARKHLPIWKLIDDRWTPQLHQPLHAAGYYLNPQLRYAESFSNDEEVRRGLFECTDRMLNYDDRRKADIQLNIYDNSRGDFGTRIAMDSRKLRSPADWWIRFGGKTPELMNFAIRVLSLICSASGCERIGALSKREKELAAVKINAADVDIIANELELDKKVAERTLREHKGDAVAAIRYLLR